MFCEEEDDRLSSEADGPCDENFELVVPLLIHGNRNLGGIWLQQNIQFGILRRDLLYLPRRQPTLKGLQYESGKVCWVLTCDVRCDADPVNEKNRL